MNDTLPLHTKYRPQKIDDLYGNSSIKESLRSVLARPAGLPHTFLFIGPSGCGKTTLARIVKDELGCADTEFIEFNTSNTRGIDTIREIQNQCRYKPLKGNVRVYLLDEVHKLTNDAQNAVLKLLEEPPAHVFFILCTTDPDKLLKTIHTRSSIYAVSLLNPREMAKFIRDICAKEDVEITDKIVAEIVKVSGGSPRQALVILDQIIDMDSEESALQAIVDNRLDEVVVKDIITIMIGNAPNKWKDVRLLLKGLKGEPEQLRYAILNYMDVVFIGGGPENLLDKMEPFLHSVMYSGAPGLHMACYLACHVK